MNIYFSIYLWSFVGFTKKLFEQKCIYFFKIIIVKSTYKHNNGPIKQVTLLYL